MKNTTFEHNGFLVEVLIHELGVYEKTGQGSAKASYIATLKPGGLVGQAAEKFKFRYPDGCFVLHGSVLAGPMGVDMEQWALDHFSHIARATIDKVVADLD